jgi:hypothetical protein
MGFDCALTYPSDPSAISRHNGAARWAPHHEKRRRQFVVDIILKSPPDILKKMFETASTLTRADDVGVFGTTMVAVPVFGVLSVSTVKVFPPSKEIEIRTLSHLMGADAVPAGSQVTFCVDPAAQTVAGAGAVTTNGP